MARFRDGTWTCRCGARNEGTSPCEGCGAQHQTGRASRGSRDAPARRERCDCGSALLASGICADTGGYPLSSRCPFICPYCRGELEWSGACPRCYGCTTGRREDWTFPGKEYRPDKGHWQETGPANRKACSPEENAEAARMVLAILSRSSLAVKHFGEGT